jgi:predicted amidohydrolase YtcJ
MQRIKHNPIEILEPADNYKARIIKVLCLCFILSLTLTNGWASSESESPKVEQLTIFTAKKFITMDQATPHATAIATSSGKIVAVGSMESLRPWMKNRKVNVDKSFKDNIVMPGFIDPHVHPSLPAITTQFPFIAPEAWGLPTGTFPAALTEKEYIQLLKQRVAQHQGDIPFVSWGYHPLWHGKIYRQELDALFPKKPVILWHRSFHELVANTAALNQLGMSKADYLNIAGVDFEKGHFWELGARLMVLKMPFIFAPDRFVDGLKNFVEMLHRGGVTTAMDMGTGIFGDAAAEMSMIQKVVEAEDAPSRILLTPIVTDFIAREVSPEDAVKEVASWKELNSDKVFFSDHFKLMLDGAIFSGLAQFGFPGYLDGHAGEWLAPYESNLAYAKAFWSEGYQIHAHTNGDKSADAFLSLVKTLQVDKPRPDHRATLEHFAYTTQDQLRNMGTLGIAISANPYYQYILSDIYADKWLGEDRARNMVPLGGAVKNGITVALHSDCPMAPLSPLTLAATAVNRVTINGNKNNQSQALSVHQAMRAITIDAAWIMNKEKEIGSLAAGKLADFVVLDKNPYTVKPSKLGQIKVLATVFEGKKYPIRPLLDTE